MYSKININGFPEVSLNYQTLTGFIVVISIGMGPVWGKLEHMRALSKLDKPKLDIEFIKIELVEP